MEERRFAGAGWAHDGNEVALIDFKIDVAQDVKELSFRERIKAFEMFECDHRHKVVSSGPAPRWDRAARRAGLADNKQPAPRRGATKELRRRSADPSPRLRREGWPASASERTLPPGRPGRPSRSKSCPGGSQARARPISGRRAPFECRFPGCVG